MKIKPVVWTFDPKSEFCCDAFRNEVFNTKRSVGSHISTDGKDVLFSGDKIFYCPYCGTKIVLEKEVEK